MTKAGKIGIVLLITALLVGGSLIGGILVGEPLPASAEEQVPQIVVTGYGSTSVSPDQAKISLGVLTMAPTAREAQQENAARANKIVGALVNAGVPKDKIATQGYSIWPEYSYPKPEEKKAPSIVAYRVSNTILITLDDIKKAGNVIDTAVAAGANQVQSIQFLRRDTGAAQREALQKACQEARQKADAIAQSLGVQIAGVQSVQESGSATPPPIVYPGAKMANVAGSAPTPIEPGELQVNASVTVVFRIK